MRKIIVYILFITIIFFSMSCFIYAKTPSSISIPVSYETNEPVDSTFVLTGINNAPMPENSTNGVKQVIKNTSGKVDFGDITITSSGYYEYKVNKITKDKEGLTKDTSEYTIHIILLDSGDLSMIIKKVGSEEKPEEIKYVDYITTIPVDDDIVSDDPPVIKKITGDTPSSKDIFTFVLEGISAPEGVNLPTINNNGNNKTEIHTTEGIETEFGRLDFDTPGEYTYKIYEAKDTNLTNYKFDTTVYIVKYTVSKENNKLSCIRNVYVDDTIVNIASFEFINEYKKPVGGGDPTNDDKEYDNPTKTKITEDVINPIKKTVKTGDATPLCLFILLLVISNIILIILVRKGKF